MSLTFWSIENVVNLFKFVYSFCKSKIIILKNNKSPLFVINFLPLKMFPQRQLSEDTKECHTDCLAWYSSDSEDDFIVKPKRKRKSGTSCHLAVCSSFSQHTLLTCRLRQTVGLDREAWESSEGHQEEGLWRLGVSVVHSCPMQSRGWWRSELRSI